MIRFYLVPVEVNPAYFNKQGPKYFPYYKDPDPPALVTPVDGQMGVSIFGQEPSCLVVADVSDPDDAALAILSDVTKFADDLDTPLGARLAAMQAALEALNLPAQMLTAATTDRQVIRGIVGIFGIGQCMNQKGFRLFGGAITLSTTLSSLSVGARQALQDCATEQGYDQTGITLASTIRQLLTKIVQQAVPKPMLGITV